MALGAILAVPPPDECIGVVGLSVALVGLTIGVIGVALLGWTFAGWALVVASLLVGWVSFLYCVVWGESTPEGEVWKG